ncbi:MAG TPA: FAD-dependent oxidoreductase, partial [Afipia sp.]|nr:FAD-dependent oxidoreductase [Afipia sp.]
RGAASGEPVYLTEAFRQGGGGFVLLQAGSDGGDQPGCHSIHIGETAPLRDASGLFAKRYDASEGAAYLLRPDGYVAARFRKPTRKTVEAAIARASAQT